jgi:glycosyltransferase EpsD
VDPWKFNPYIPVKTIRQQLNIASEDFIISFIARHTFQKDPLSFIKAIPAICKEVPHAKFLMIGDGELKEACVQLASQLSISHKIIFQPFRNDVKELLDLTDIFVLPSLWEVTPLGLMEAMAMEKTCIATAIPGTTEALKDEYNGYLVDVHAPDQIASKVILLAKNAALRKQLGKNARHTILTHFDIDTLVKKNEQVYLKLTGIDTACPLLTPDLPVSSDYPLIAG